ncbi:hypothetical protein QTH41_04370 [Clostridium perfringens]|nr:hypothetical protein [Clostridium perfringens]
MTILDKFKILNDIDKQSELKVQVLINICTNKILTLTGRNRNEITEELEDLILEFTILRWNKLGIEGLTSPDKFTEAISDNLIPPDIKIQLNKFKKLRSF